MGDQMHEGFHLLDSASKAGVNVELSLSLPPSLPPSLMEACVSTYELGIALSASRTDMTTCLGYAHIFR